MTLRLHSFDFLRAACALMVLAGHLCTEMGIAPNRILLGATSFGTEAVVGFFVLSGCLISMQDYGSRANYLRARLVRIVPNYYVMLIFSAVAMLAFGVAFPASNLVANALFLQTLDWSPANPLNWYAQSWSLSYEIWYYIGFLAILAWPRLLLPLFVASLGVGIALYFTPKPPDAVNALLRAFAFFSIWLSGVLVTWLVRRGHGVSIETGAFMMAVGFCLSREPFSSPAKFDFGLLFNFGIGFAFLVWALVTQAMPGVSRVHHFNLVVRAVISAVVLTGLWRWSDSFLEMKEVMTALVVAFAVLPGRMVRIVTVLVRPLLPFMTYVGGLSYALYLVHYPVLHVLYQAHPFTPVVNALIVLLLSFAIAHLLDYGMQPRIVAAVRGRKHA
ncbi:MAG: acyltransferase [Proteobacteria bacterium]|nr:acyltransferase [Pseudomonadota bacterium]